MFTWPVDSLVEMVVLLVSAAPSSLIFQNKM